MNARLLSLMLLLVSITGYSHGFAQTITNDDLERQYGPTKASEDSNIDIERRRDDNIQALDSLNCSQLRAAGKTKSREYRKSCMTSEQREDLQKDQASRQARSAQVMREFREAERDRKINDLHTQIQLDRR